MLSAFQMTALKKIVALKAAGFQTFKAVGQGGFVVDTGVNTRVLAVLERRGYISGQVFIGGKVNQLDVTEKGHAAVLLENLVAFAHKDPKGFLSALVNTMDTATESTGKTEGFFHGPQSEREAVLVNYILRHES